MRMYLNAEVNGANCQSVKYNGLYDAYSLRTPR